MRNLMEGSAASAGISQQLSVLRELLPESDRRRLSAALDYAAQIYGDRMHDLVPGLSLFDHAFLSAQFLGEFCKDEDALIACILQHALRCPDVTIGDIGREFGRSVRDMVSRVHLLSHLYTTDWRKSVNDMKIMLVSVADDIRVLLIVLSIACILAERIPVADASHRMRLARQSLQLFAPVAARLGMYALKYRLEKAAFPESYPTDAQHIGQQLDRLGNEHGKDFLRDTAQAIRQFLKKEGITAEVMARQKQPYSIFQKMKQKSVSALEKITDLFAIRVVVPEVSDCYQTLGHLHRLATPISHRFKDYISFPKPNGYQSLHTCLIGLPHAPNDVMVEVQIRTPEMHREAEYGIAAHWLYKEQGKKVIDSAQQFHLSDVLLKQQTVCGTSDTHEDELALVDHIYVLTPRGDIIELPDGGTPLDFAFVLHTDLGLRFKSARVNGSIVPISHRLENGDVVEIQTHKYPQPALHWMEDMATASARSKLKAYFFSHNRPQFLLRGREMVNAELKTRGQPALDAELSVVSSGEDGVLTLRDREDLLVKVGMGSARTSSILRGVPIRPKQTPRSRPAAVKPGAVRDLVSVEGEPLDLPYRFAKCCSPQTADPRPEKLTGIVTRAGFLSIHKDGCRMAKSASPGRKVKVKWTA